MGRPRNIRAKLEAGQRAYGFAVQFPSPELVELGAAAGYDYVWIDAEHGSLDLSDLREMIRAADASGIDSIVRVPDHTPSFIQRVLDLGATGIMAPHVRTLEEATALVASAKYSPVGVRGACPFTRSVNHVSTDWPADYTRADRDVLVFGLIEDIEGVENLEAIAADSGLDALLCGPFDLGQALGLEADVSHPTVRDMHDRVVEACRKAGIEYVTAGVAWEFGAEATNGSRVITVVGDRGSIFEAWGKALQDVRSTLSQFPLQAIAD
ncbi:HpcH/HpaI aldolase family protein [Streptomyces graminofaciens]|uniref:HpcH/HpaI aldolase family protein n=1 Tax=Streptomyces graminofaciens TaxID=68212 RepID=UPI0025731884|nr:aldolase/citrate lyase family protein [Streptomyces graminofaciens]